MYLHHPFDDCNIYINFDYTCMPIIHGLIGQPKLISHVLMAYMCNLKWTCHFHLAVMEWAADIFLFTVE